MTRARTRIPLLPHFNLGNRQRRHHRFLDEVREVLARGLLSPIDDGAFPHATDVSGTFAPAVAQPVVLTGTHFLQDGVQAVGATDALVGAADVDWKVITPGLAGNNMTLAIVDGGGGAPTVVTTPTTTSVVVTLDVAGGVTAQTVINAVAAHATARTMIIGVASGGGGGNVTAQTATFSGGIGEGDYGVEIAATAQTILDWTSTVITAELDLSGFSHGDLIEAIIIADGIEYRFNVLCSAGGAPAGGGRVGTGFFAGTAGVLVDLDTFTIDGHIYRVYDNLAPAPAPVAGTVDIAVTVAGPLPVNVGEVVAGVNADLTRTFDAAPVGAAAAETGVGFVPHAPAGNLVVTHTMTNWLWSEGASPSAMVDGSGNPITLVPFQHTFSAGDADELAAGRWVQIGSFPSASAPFLAGFVLTDTNGSHYSKANVETQVAFDGVTGMYNLQMLDPGGAIGIVATDIVSGFLAA